MSTPEERPKRQAAIKADAKIRQLQEQEKSSSEETEIYDDDNGEDERSREEEQGWRNAQSVIQTPSTREEVHRNDPKPVSDEVDVISSELRSMDITDPRVAEVCKQFKQALGSLRQSPIPTMEHSFATCATQASVIQQHSSFHYPAQQPPSQVVMPMGSAAGYQPGIPCYAPQAAPNHPAFTYAQPAMNQQFHPGVQPQQTYYAVPPHHQANFQPTANHQFGQGFPMQQANFAMPPQQQMAVPGIQDTPATSQQMAQLIGLQLAAQKKSDLQKASADLQKIPCLAGYEGESTLRDFFKGFEKLSLGLSDAERVELLLARCKGRARRIGEELQQEVDCNYQLIKKNLSKRILQASTEQSEAMRSLASNYARNRGETLAVYAERLTRTVKKAYPDSDKPSHERLLNYYFMEGIRDVQLKGILSTKRQLPFEEKVAEAILLEHDIHPGRNTPRQHGEREVYRQRSEQGPFDGGAPSQRGYGYQGAQRQFQNYRRQEQGFIQSGTQQQKAIMAPQKQFVARHPMGTEANRTPMGVRQGQRDPNPNSNRNWAQQVHQKDKKETPSNKESIIVPTLTLTINGQMCRGLVDTGASISILSQGCFGKIVEEPGKLKNTTRMRRCVASNGQPLKFIGETDLSVEYKGVETPNVTFAVSADTFGHDLIIGTDILAEFGFEIYDRRNDCYHTLASLDQMPLDKSKKETVVRVLEAAVVRPNTTSTVKVSFDEDGEQVYLLEPPDSFGSDIRLESALVNGNRKDREWKVHNNTQSAIILQSGAVVGYASEVEKVFDEKELHGNAKDNKEIDGEVNMCNATWAAEEEDMPYAPTLNATLGDLTKDDPKRLKELIEQIAANCTELEMSRWETITELISQYSECFAVDDSELTQTDIVTHSIDTGDNVPIKSRARPIPRAMRDQVTEMVLKYLAQGIIRKSHSPWSSPIVLVKKKDGTIRMCVDYRKLNDVTVKDAFPVPNINELLTTLGKKRYFTTFDLLSGYWQVRMDPESIAKTAFSAPMGHYEFTVLPFGLTNAVATFQRAMQGVFEDLLNDFVFVYVDDIMIASETWEEHVRHVTEVLSRLRNAGLRLKAKKCKFGRQQVQFLGYLLTQEGIKIDPEKLGPIRNFPEPKSVKDLQRFLGLAAYNRKFVYNFAHIAAPLNNLLKTGTTFKFDEICREAFNNLKDKLCTDVTLIFPDFEAAQTDPKRRFVLMTDASLEGLGGVLCQPDNEGHSRPIHFVSRRCSAAERNYSATELEALAIKFCCDKLEQYIAFLPVTVLTDHKPLEGMFKKRGSTNKRITRFISELVPHFPLEVTYHAGKINVMADALSRAFSEPAEVKGGDTTGTDQAMAVEIAQGSWKQLLRREDEFRDLIAFLDSNELPRSKDEIEKIINLAEYYATDEDHLYFIGKDKKHKKVVPKGKQEEVMKEFHEGIIGVHASAEKTKEMIGREFHWRNMFADCKKRCRECEVCLLNRTARNAKPPLEAIRTSTVMELLCVDLLKLGPSRSGNLYALVMIDHFSKYLVATAIPDKSATTVVAAITNDWIARFGSPCRIHSDKGTEFCNSTMDTLCGSLGIVRSSTSPYNPKGNGVTERVNRDIISMLRKTITSKFDWDQRLPFVVLAHNMMKHSTTGFSPYEVVFGRPPRLPVVDEASKHPNPSYLVDTDAHRALLLENLDWLRRETQHGSDKAGRISEDYYNDRHKTKPNRFSIGDRVFIKKLAVGEVARDRHHKVLPKNEGPYKVTGTRRTAVEIEKGPGRSEWIRLDRVIQDLRNGEEVDTVNCVTHACNAIMYTSDDKANCRIIPEMMDSSRQLREGTDPGSHAYSWYKEGDGVTEVAAKAEDGDTVNASGGHEQDRQQVSPRLAMRKRSQERKRRAGQQRHTACTKRTRSSPDRTTLETRKTPGSTEEPGAKHRTPRALDRNPQRKTGGANDRPDRVTHHSVTGDRTSATTLMETVLIGDRYGHDLSKSCNNPFVMVKTASELKRELRACFGNYERTVLMLSRNFHLDQGPQEIEHLLDREFELEGGRRRPTEIVWIAPYPASVGSSSYDHWLKRMEAICRRHKHVHYKCVTGGHSIISPFTYGEQPNKMYVEGDGGLNSKGRFLLATNLRVIFKIPLEWKEKKEDRKGDKKVGERDAAACC